jgi:Uncharacterized protein conserved in bacteria (DUF2213)
MATELDVAEAVASGVLPSPTRLQNSDYVALRISGTGAAYRPSKQEYAYRDSEIWTSPEMQRRVLGLPVIIEHPADSVMDSKYFGDRAVGMIVHSYVKNDELWGVARIVDATASAMIQGEMFDTSPAVVFTNGQGAFVDLDDDKLLVEGNPDFIDHVALVYTGGGNKGVWTRNGNGPGVEVTETEKEIA